MTYIDPRIADLITVTNGERWEVTEVHWLDEAESEGMHHIWLYVRDEDGGPMANWPVRVSWADGETVVTMNEYGEGDFPMYATLGAYTVAIAGASVKGLGMGTPEHPDVKLHTSFEVNFRRVPEPTQPPEPPQETERAPGLDVSEYQGDVNWNDVAAAGYQFTFIRINEQLRRDKRFNRNWRGAGEAGLLRGVYYGLSSRYDPELQANWFLTNFTEPGELPVVLDFESKSIGWGEVADWLDYLAGVGVPAPLIYTNLNYWRWDGSFGLPLWVADWGEGRIEPRLPKAWDTWEFWQWRVTEKGEIPGIPGKALLDWFNGTTEQLQERYGGG